MGSLILPRSGTVYAGAQIFIYSIEKHPDYAPFLLPLWHAVAGETIEVVSSELSLMETLVGPLERSDAQLVADYEKLFQQDGIRLISISRDMLRDAAKLRAANSAIRTPDALHAATARLIGCSMFLTNDAGFRRVPGLPFFVLSEMISS